MVVVVVAAYHKPRDPYLIAEFLHMLGYKGIKFNFPIPCLYDTAIIATD